MKKPRIRIAIKDTAVLKDRKKAPAYAKALYMLRQEMDRELKPKDVIEAARNPKNALHDYFEWDNRKAADRYRLDQARYLLGAVRVEIIDPDTGETTNSHRWLTSVKIFEGDAPEPIRVYQPEDVAKLDPFTRNQILCTALRELSAWAGKYKDYKELAEVATWLERTASRMLPNFMKEVAKTVRLRKAERRAGRMRNKLVAV